MKSYPNIYFSKELWVYLLSLTINPNIYVWKFSDFYLRNKSWSIAYYYRRFHSIAINLTCLYFRICIHLHPMTILVFMRLFYPSKRCANWRVKKYLSSTQICRNPNLRWIVCSCRNECLQIDPLNRYWNIQRLLKMPPKIFFRLIRVLHDLYPI